MDFAKLKAHLRQSTARNLADLQVAIAYSRFAVSYAHAKDSFGRLKMQLF